MKLPTFVFCTALGTLSLLAQNRVSSPTPAPEQIRWEWREVAVTDIRDLRFGASKGAISFSIGEESYTYSPDYSDGARSSPAADVSACAAVLAELRKAKKLKMHVAISPNDKGNHGLTNLILLLEDPK